MKRRLCIFGIICVFALTSFHTFKNQNQKYTITKIVIDPGHGGNDPGCIGKKSKEKNIALDIALKLGNYIKNNLKDVEVIYTRSDDSFVELYKRAKIANENKADLFISIHCNASPKSDPYGVESYVMGINKIEGNLEIASKENASILMESDYQKQYEGFDPDKGFDPNSPEFMISYNLYQKTYSEQSLDIASKVQKHLSGDMKRFNRGVKQAGFLVLWRTTMPSILIETGFLSNPTEEEYLITEKGRSNIAFGIYKAFKEYKCKIEGVEYTVSENEASIEKQNSRTKNGEQPTEEKENPKNSHSNIKEIKQADSLQTKDIESKKIDISSETNIKDVVFKVQFATSPDKKLLNSPAAKDLQNIDFYQHDGVYKFTVGKENDLDKAIDLQNKMRSKGYKDAFVVAFYNGNRISVKDALNILKK